MNGKIYVFRALFIKTSKNVLIKILVDSAAEIKNFNCAKCFDICIQTKFQANEIIFQIILTHVRFKCSFFYYNILFVKLFYFP